MPAQPTPPTENPSEQHRHECECREWLARIRAKRPATTQEGQAMLKELIADIAKRRGDVAAERLRVGIEAARAAHKAAKAGAVQP